MIKEHRNIITVYTSKNLTWHSGQHKKDLIQAQQTLLPPQQHYVIASTVFS